MSITIENPTAEEIIAAIKAQIPDSEFERLKILINQESEETSEEEELVWHTASTHAATRFFEEA
jgi:hypothetical protein